MTEKLAWAGVLSAALVAWAAGFVDSDIGRAMVIVASVAAGLRARSRIRPGTGIRIPSGRLVPSRSQVRIWVGVLMIVTAMWISGFLIYYHEYNAVAFGLAGLAALSGLAFAFEFRKGDE
jgi:hypothetical protein